MRVAGRLTQIAIATVLSGTFAPPVLADEIDDRVRAVYSGMTTDFCDDHEILVPDMYELTYRQDYEGAPELPIRIYRFPCFSGAYNEAHVFFSWTELDGVQPVAFAVPSFEANCAARAATFECTAVADVALTGYTTRNVLINSTFVPGTQELTSRSCWRGFCDASEVGLWVLEHGVFVLKTYGVDASYNNEVDLIEVVGILPLAPQPRPIKG